MTVVSKEELINTWSRNTVKANGLGVSLSSGAALSCAQGLSDACDFLRGALGDADIVGKEAVEQAFEAFKLDTDKTHYPNAQSLVRAISPTLDELF